MKPLIVVTSCVPDMRAGKHQAIRDTWGSDPNIDVRFILGYGSQPLATEPDELCFNCPDDYGHVTFKTREAHAWADWKGYGHVLQCFTDTYVNVPVVLNSDYAQYDYVGFFKGILAPTHEPDIKGRYAYASGGVGYWTSAKANAVLAKAEIGPDIFSWAEDLWVGTSLGQAGIYGHHDERYRLEATWFLDWFKARRIGADAIFSLHLGRGTGVYDPQWMYDAHSILQGA